MKALNSVIIKMKSVEKYYGVVLFITLYKVVLTLASVDKILNCEHSNKSYWAVLSCGAVYYAVQGSNACVCGWKPKVRTIKMNSKATEHYFAVSLKK